KATAWLEKWTGCGMEPHPVCPVLDVLVRPASPPPLPLPPSHPAETIAEFAGIWLARLAGLVSELAETGFETSCRGAALAVVLGTAAEKLAADPVELLLHLDVTGEVERLEVVDELHEPVEGFLMGAFRFARAHRSEHFFTEAGGLLAQL